MSPLKALVLIAAAVIFIDITEATISLVPAGFNPLYPGKCYDKVTGRILSHNEEFKPEEICLSMTCDAIMMVISTETCPDIEVPGCDMLPGDPLMQFPMCCPQYKCVDSKAGDKFIDALLNEELNKFTKRKP